MANSSAQTRRAPPSCFGQLTGKRKPYIYTSTIAVGEQIPAGALPRTPTSGHQPDPGIDDLRQRLREQQVGRRGAVAPKLRAVRPAGDASDLADTSYTGQLNLPDMFTRLMLSLAALASAQFVL